MKAKGEVWWAGAGDRKDRKRETEKHCHSHPPPAGVCSGTNRQASRKGCEEGSTVSTALWGDQAWKPDSYTSCVRLQAAGETLTHSCTRT